MSNTDIPELDKAGLRKFGLTTGVVFVLLFGLALPWLFSISYPKWPWIVAALLITWAILIPGSLKPVYYGWMRLAHVLAFINTHIVLFLLYYVVFFPIALLFKLIGKDPMARSLTPSAKDSYRVVATKRDHKHFERPY
jgi:hypothetical protein